MVSHRLDPLKSVVLVVFSHLVGCSVSWAVDKPLLTSEEKDALKIPLKVTVSIPRPFYKGLPCLAHLRIENPRPLPRRDTTAKDPSKKLTEKQELERATIESRSRIPLTYLSSPPPISTTLINPREKRAVQTTAAPFMAYYSLHPALNERFEETSRIGMAYERRVDFVVNLSPQLIELAPGEYTLKVRLHQSWTDSNWVWDAKPVTFRLKRLPDKVQQVIRAAHPDLPKNPAKFERGDWIGEKIDIATLEAKLPAELFSSLALHAFLSSVSRHGIAKARLELLDKAPADLKPLADCLRYKALLARKETDAAKRLRAKIAKEHPGLKWRLESIDRHARANEN